MTPFIGRCSITFVYLCLWRRKFNFFSSHLEELSLLKIENVATNYLVWILDIPFEGEKVINVIYYQWGIFMLLFKKKNQWGIFMLLCAH